MRCRRCTRGGATMSATSAPVLPASDPAMFIILTLAMLVFSLLMFNRYGSWRKVRAGLGRGVRGVSSPHTRPRAELLLRDCGRAVGLVA